MTIAPPIVNALAHDKAEVLKEVELMIRDLSELSKDCEDFVYKHRLKWGHGWRTVKENIDAS